MRNLTNLADDLFRLANTLPFVVAQNVSIGAARVILADLLAVTPVDTSQAISNWRVTLNAPVISQIPAYFPGKGGFTAQASRDSAWRAGLSVLATKQPGQQIFIGNALPYIRKLNDGSSTQAPAGFVERATLLGQLYVQNPANFANAVR